MRHQKQVEIITELMAQIDEGRNVDAGEQVRVSTDAYHNPNIARTEWDRLFRDHPQLLGFAGELPEPGSYFTTNDFGVPVLAVRGRDGKFRAFLNACRHRGVRVAEDGHGKANSFTCPFHSWTYSNQGDLVAIPQEEHFGKVDKACNGLVALPSEEWHGMLWVHPNPEGELNVESLLDDFAGELAMTDWSRFVYSGESILNRKLNWKLANDTFGETYHFGKLHRNTLGQLFYGDNLSYQTAGRNHRFVFASKGIDALRDRPQAEWQLTDAANLIYYLFPNIQLNYSAGTVSLVKIYPDPEDPGRSISRISFYHVPELVALLESPPEGIEIIGAEDAYNNVLDATHIPSLEAVQHIFVSTVEEEDYLMGESTQRAVESGLLPTLVFGRNEPALHHYHRTFAEFLGLPQPQII